MGRVITGDLADRQRQRGRQDHSDVEKEDDSKDCNTLVGSNEGNISLDTSGESGISLEDEQKADGKR